MSCEVSERTTEQICPHCDMPRFGCEHGRGETHQVRPPDPPEPAVTFRAWAWSFDSPGYRSTWQTLNGPHRLEPIRCTDEHQTGDRRSYLCPGCSELFAACLADLPGLAEDLELARAKQVTFIQHGHRMGRAAQGAEEALVQLPYSPAASEAARRLQTALQAASADPRDLALAALTFHAQPWGEQTRDRVAQVSAAVIHAFAVVDRPPDLWYFGECPQCRADLYAERTADTVSCPSAECSYQATRTDHQRACLDAGEDRLLTVGELVGAITSAGEAVTRDQINGFIRREGLPREKVSRPSWRKGTLTYREVYVYRLGDVREMAHRRAS